MSRRNKQAKHLHKFAENKKKTSRYVIVCLKMFVLSLYFTGMNYTAASIMLLLNNIVAPSKSSFYSCQQEIAPLILQYARENAENELKKVPFRSPVAIDGSWSSRRNAQFCIVDAISIETKKIIDFEIVIKSTSKIKGNYHGPSNLMEAEGFKRMFPRLLNSKKVSSIVIDGDVKIPKLVNQMSPDVQVLRDYTHYFKNLPNLFKKYNKNTKGKLRGTKTQIINQFKSILFSESNVILRYQRIQELKFSIINKIKNIDRNTIDAITSLFDELLAFSVNFHQGVTTNYCESYHNIKAHLAPKMFSYGISWVPRMACSILQYNNPNFWLFELLRRLKITALSIETIIDLVNIFKTKVKANQKKKQPEKVHQTNKSRIIRSRKSSIPISRSMEYLAHI